MTWREVSAGQVGMVARHLMRRGAGPDTVGRMTVRLRTANDLDMPAVGAAHRSRASAYTAPLTHQVRYARAATR
ncbi:hypothetical protein C1I95_11750 [Micromonospora craterilacus]|uniref:Uncharacterized protein n=1 Tax=Micromonospora craterilacus TaxID=1655439 RepID=A0A2W2E9Y9_9ACTN|nr:hypothetical protein C1I95_11750 [Micromonospora craterilacus]